MESKIIYGIVVALCIVSIQSAYAEFTFDFKFGSSGSSNTQLDEPTDVILNKRDSMIYVVDNDKHRISVFDNNRDGRFLSDHGELCDIEDLNNCDGDERGANKDGDGQFNGPTSIAKDGSDTFFVVDSDNDRVQIFKSDPWEFESEFGSSSRNADDYFNSAAGIAFQDLRSGNGRIIVSDNVDDSISVFDIDGIFEFTFKLSDLDGQSNFDGPTNMVVDNDRLYVSDTNKTELLF